jgi:hypothetical protein
VPYQPQRRKFTTRHPREGGYPEAPSGRQVVSQDALLDPLRGDDGYESLNHSFISWRFLFYDLR